MWIFDNMNTFWDLFITIFAIIIIIWSISSIVFVLYWWLLLILSWWQEEKIKIWINTIKYALYWLVAIVVAIYLFPILWNLLWLNVEQYANPSIIFAKIKVIWDIILWTSSYAEPSDLIDL